MALKGCTVCSTGIDRDKKSVLESSVIRLGGTYENVLTVRTTHLICEGTGTEKYRVAVSKGCKTVTAAWVDACEAAGKAVDDAPYRVLPLQGCVLCPTGLSSEMRDSLQATARENGAEFTSDLTKRCTHLIAERVTGLKCDYATKWETPIVTPQWVADSVARHFRQDESLYLAPPANPTATANALQTTASTTTNAAAAAGSAAMGASLCESERRLGLVYQPAVQPALCLAGCVVALVGFSKAEDSAIEAELTRLGAERESVLARNLTHVVLAPGRLASQTILSCPTAKFVNPEWVHSSEREGKRASEDDFRPIAQPVKVKTESPAAAPVSEHPTVKAEAPQQSTTATATTATAAVIGVLNSPMQQAPETTKDASGKEKELFRGLAFDSVGFEKEQRERNVAFVRYYGGSHLKPRSAPEVRQRVNYVVAPHGWHSNALAEAYPNAAVVSPQWLELSRDFAEPLDPSECRILVPLPRTLPYVSMFAVCLSTTGFSVRETKMIMLMAHDLGAQFTASFSRANTHLVCKRATGTKFERAKHWKKPAVTIEWLNSCAVEGELQPCDLFLVGNGGASGAAAPAIANPARGDGDCIDGPLRGVVAFVSTSKTMPMERAQELLAMVTRLGGEPVWDYTPRVTHYILDGVERSRQYKRAVQNNAHMVSPAWVENCSETSSRVPESRYPPQVVTSSKSPALDFASVGFGLTRSAPLLDFVQQKGRTNSSLRRSSRGARGDPPMSVPECQAFFDQHDRLVAGEEPLNIQPRQQSNAQPLLQQQHMPHPQPQQQVQSAAQQRTFSAPMPGLRDIVMSDAIELPSPMPQPPPATAPPVAAPSPKKKTNQELAQCITTLRQLIENGAVAVAEPMPARKKVRRTSSGRKQLAGASCGLDTVVVGDAEQQNDTGSGYEEELVTYGDATSK